MSAKVGVALRLLDKYFATVKNLRSYLEEILHEVDFAPRDTDSVAYKDLLNTTLLGSNQNTLRTIQFSPPICYMREVIQRAQEKLLRTAAKRGVQNVITEGYLLYDKRKDQRTVNNTHVNTNVTALQAPEWEELFSRIGTDAMLHLLTETSIFYSLPNGCFCQLVGEPILYARLDDVRVYTAAEPSALKRGTKRAVPFANEERRAKRVKLDKGTGSNLVKTVEASTAHVLLIRGRLFYARPLLRPHSNEIAVGLPPKHILNRLNPSQPRVLKSMTEPYPRKQMDDARHFAKYVFPRQYGLSSAFRFQAPRRDVKTPSFDDREAEIKGSFKTPKRLKEVVPMLEKLVWRHGKCKYKLLRDHACPSKVKELQNVDSSGILELISEHSSSAPRTQKSVTDISIDSEGNSILPSGLTQAAQHAKTKPRFVEYSCSHVEVWRYAVLISRAVIPKGFWGTESNFTHVLRHVKEYISCRRYEVLSLHHVIQGFSTSACEWLMPPGDGSRQARVPISDALKRRELLEDFLYWYFDGFILPLLRTTFYVTESSALRNQVLYFRQDDWEFLCKPLVERLAGGTFEKLTEAEANHILRQRKLGFSFVRLLPKETGVRPIANLKRKNSSHNGQSINKILQAAFKILTYERDTRPHLVGVSVFSANDVYVRLKEFKTRLPKDGQGNLPRLYFVKVDVQACFDTIPQNKLLEILRDLISEDAYMIQRYGKVASEAGNVKRSYIHTAIPDDDYPHFLKVAADLANVLHNTIFIDQVRYTRAVKDEILQLLEEHITENIVKIGKEYYRQTIGIPQGSVLSSILCAFFYGDLEKRFGRYTEDPHSALLRQTDDYLLITTDLAKARGFLTMMSNGHEEYGCFISKEKTVTNFDFDEQLNSIPHERGFPWCGYVIDTRNLSVSVEYSRYHGTDINNTLTVGRGRRPGATFRYKMLQLAKARSHIIYTDTSLNTLHTVYLNIYQNFLLSALKMNGYICEWGLDTRKNAAFLRDTVQQVISYALVVIRNKASTRFSVSHGGKADVQKSAVTWLGMHAFYAILSRKPARYAGLLEMLQAYLAKPLNGRYARRFRRLTREGLAEMAPIDPNTTI